jgi:hypothetical protein
LKRGNKWYASKYSSIGFAFDEITETPHFEKDGSDIPISTNAAICPFPALTIKAIRKSIFV